MLSLESRDKDLNLVQGLILFYLTLTQQMFGFVTLIQLSFQTNIAM